MQKQLSLLLQLQQIDSRTFELLAEIEDLPKKLAPAQRDLASLEAILADEKQRVSETESWKSDQEALIQTDEDAIKKAKIKLQGAKNSKDYGAATRELEGKRKSKSEREDEVLKVMEALEKSRSQAESHEEDISGLRTRVREEEEKARVRIIELETEAKERTGDRQHLVEQIDAELIQRYEAILKKRKPALVEVIDGVCGGCHMSVPPQLANDLARMDSLASCPRCNRLLYRQELLDAESEE